MHFLVTGCAGFIGSKVCEFLLAEGHNVVGVDNLNDYYDPALKRYRLSCLAGVLAPAVVPISGTKEGDPALKEHRLRQLEAGAVGDGQGARGSVNAGSRRQEAGDRTEESTISRQGAMGTGKFQFHRLDIENLAELECVFAAHSFDAVFNIAARAGVRASIENPYVYLSTNVTGTLNVLECMRKHGVGKLVLASSSSLYAGCHMPFTEDQPVNEPRSPYAASKKAAELLAYSYHKLHGIDISVVRYFTVFGPAGRPDMAPFRFIKWIDEGKAIQLYGDGSQARDFTYVDDIARGTILAAKPLGYEIINLGGGRNPITLHQLIGMMERAIGKKAIIEGKPFHPADIKDTWADIGKAARLLGWSPQISIEEGIRRTVAWHLANRDLVKTIQV